MCGCVQTWNLVQVTGFTFIVSEPLKGFLVKDVRRYSLQMFIC